jgi:hypothetical protein
MADRITTNIQGGINNSILGTDLETYISVDPSTVHQYYNDFDVFTAGDWTSTGTHTPTNVLTAGDGGILSMVNLATSADLDQLTLKVATFSFTPGIQAWFKCRFQIGDATNSQIVLGLQNLNTNAFAATDGVWWQKSVGVTTGNFIVSASSTQTTSGAALTLVANVYNTVGFYYDGSNLNLYYTGSAVGTVATTNLPPSTTNLALTIAVNNGTSAAQTMLVDYILAAKQRGTVVQVSGA